MANVLEGQITFGKSRRAVQLNNSIPCKLAKLEVAGLNEESVEGACSMGPIMRKTASRDRLRSCNKITRIRGYVAQKDFSP